MSIGRYTTPFVLFLVLIGSALTACKSKATREGPSMKLPESYLGDWSYTNHPREGHKVPNHWKRLSLKAREIKFSVGEQSKDSGRRWLEGEYEVLSGQGSREQPYMLRVEVRKKGCSESHGYSQPFKVEDEFQARLYMDGERLFFFAPGFGSERLSKGDAARQK